LLGALILLGFYLLGALILLGFYLLGALILLGFYLLGALILLGRIKLYLFNMPSKTSGLQHKRFDSACK
jgi:hypothetical protein